ncbi:MAG: response regulator [Thermoanaerobaculia bacterium]|nr:response regulator [Thermoanaerobaculia bacterium]
MNTPTVSDTRVLVVDDEPQVRELLVVVLEEEGYEVETAEDGLEAWERLQEEKAIDVVLLDWMMPRMDGLELLGKIKGHPRLQMMPVIMETGKADHQDFLTGIEAGAYYYVTKPLDVEMVLSMVGTAASDAARHREIQERLDREALAWKTLREGRFRFRTLEEASGLAALLSRGFPQAERTVVGLEELLVNAVEHGNLGLSYDEKSELLEEGRWREEVRRRLEMPEYRDRWAEVRYERTEDAVRVTIADEGEGFEWEEYLTVSPERVFHPHGRGIAIANELSFDELEYRDPGNRVTAVTFLDGGEG